MSMVRTLPLRALPTDLLSIKVCSFAFMVLLPSACYRPASLPIRQHPQALFHVQARPSSDSLRPFPDSASVCAGATPTKLPSGSCMPGHLRSLTPPAPSPALSPKHRPAQLPPRPIAQPIPHKPHPSVPNSMPHAYPPARAAAAPAIPAGKPKCVPQLKRTRAEKKQARLKLRSHTPDGSARLVQDNVLVHQDAHALAFRKQREANLARAGLTCAHPTIPAVPLIRSERHRTEHHLCVPGGHRTNVWLDAHHQACTPAHTAATTEQQASPPASSEPTAGEQDDVSNLEPCLSESEQAAADAPGTSPDSVVPNPLALVAPGYDNDYVEMKRSAYYDDTARAILEIPAMASRPTWTPCQLAVLRGDTRPGDPARDDWTRADESAAKRLRGEGSFTSTVCHGPLVHIDAPFFKLLCQPCEPRTTSWTGITVAARLRQGKLHAYMNKAATGTWHIYKHLEALEQSIVYDPAAKRSSRAGKR